MNEYLKLLLGIIIVAVVSYYAYSALKIPPPQGPLAEAIKKIHENFAKKHEGASVDLNSPVVILSETVATTAFAAAILGTLLFWKKRLTYVMWGVAALVLLGVAPFEMVIEHMELGLILFLVSMMIIVEYLNKTGVLGWITVKVVKASKFKPLRFIVILGFLSWIMAALVDEVTSIVFITRVVLTISALLDVNPVPLIIYTVMATNIGSSATMIGNPIGIYIALQSGADFATFVRWATPGSLLALLFLFVVMFPWLRKSGLFKAMIEKSKMIELDEWSSIKGLDSQLVEAYKRGELKGEEKRRVEAALREFKKAWMLFIITMLLIVFHTEIAHLITEALHAFYGPEGIHAEVNHQAMLILSPLIVAGYIIATHKEPRELVERGVEWWTLLFFMFLFAIASALSYTGVTDRLAYALLLTAGGVDLGATITLIVVIAAVAAIISGFLDNMPVVVALSPIVKTLEVIGLPYAFSLWWALLYGGTIGGNLTIIGSTANIVALGMLEREGKHIPFMEWFKIGIVSVAITLGVALLLLIARVLLGLI